MNISIFTDLNSDDSNSCQNHRVTRLMEKNPVGVTAFCTQKQRDQLPLKNVYRIKSVIGVYRLSRRESHICYDGQVVPNLIPIAQLSGGNYYQVVNWILIIVARYSINLYCTEMTDIARDVAECNISLQGAILYNYCTVPSAISVYIAPRWLILHEA